MVFVRGDTTFKNEDGAQLTSKDGYNCSLLIVDEYSNLVDICGCFYLLINHHLLKRFKISYLPTDLPLDYAEYEAIREEH